MTVPTKRFGRTEVQMPVLTCGGMRFQQAWKDLGPDEIEPKNQENLEATVHAALAHGINHFETARGYGSSEMQLGWVLPKLDREKIVEAYTPRVMSFAMLSSAGNMSSVELFGVKPETEAKLSKIDDAMQKGEFFTGDSKRDIILGSKLAELLEVQLGDRVVATVAQAHSGELSQEL